MIIPSPKTCVLCLNGQININEKQLNSVLVWCCLPKPKLNMDVIFPQKWWIITWIWKLKIKWSFIKSVQTSDWFHCFSFVNHIPGYINMQPSFFSITFDESLIMISTHFQINLLNKYIEIKNNNFYVLHRIQ